MSNMRLISEEITEKCNVIVEDSDSGKKKLFIEGINLQAEVKNKNGRIYPKRTMHEEVLRYVKEYVDSGRAVGELGHPPNPQINLDKVSHRVVSLKESGNDYIGKSLILDTTMGNIARGLLDGGVQLGTSSRALGSLVESNGAKIVQNDFRLVTPSDIVYDPSAPSAFVNGIMEGVEYFFDADKQMIMERPIEEAQAIVETFVQKRELNEERMLELFEKFLHNPKNFNQKLIRT